MKKVLLWLTAFVLPGVYVKAQQSSNGHIEGNIHERVKDKIIAGATVLLQGISDSLRHNVVLSNKYGRFSFSTPGDGRYIIIITHAGFRTYRGDTLVIGGKNRDLHLPVILLQADTVLLEEVVVRSRRNNYMERQLDRTVINTAALASNTGANTMEVLNNLPGVMVDADGTISLAGKEGVLVLIDDKPTHLSGPDLINYLRSLPSAGLDKVELIPNPPARYSAEGAAGIINIRTKKIKSRGFNGNLSLNYGSGRYFKSNNNMGLSYRNDKLNVYGNAGYVASKGLFHIQRQRDYHYPNAAYMLHQDVYESNHEKNFTYKLGVDYDLNKFTSLGILFSGSSAPYNETGNYKSLYTSSSAIVDSIIWSHSSFANDPHNNAANINIRQGLNTNGSAITINLDWLHYAARGDQNLASSTYLTPDSLSGIYTLVSVTPLSARIYGIKADYNGRFLKDIQIESGAQATWSLRNNRGDYSDNLLDNNFRYKENINALYINLRESLSHISWQAGLRVENTHANAAAFDMPARPDTSFTLRYTNIFPTLYVSYKPDTGSKRQFVFSAGRRISRPGYQSLNPSIFFFDRNTSITGNSLLQPQFATNFELSYSTDGPLTVSLLYSRRKNDIITGYRQAGNNLISTQVNIDCSTSAGINASTLLEMTSWWSVNLYMDLMNTTYKGALFGGETVLDSHLFSFSLQGSNQLTFKKGWAADITGIYNTRRLYGQSLRQPAWQLHAGLRKKLGDKASLSLAARDIFHSWRIKRVVTIPYATIAYDYVSDSQQLGLTFNYRFGRQIARRERKMSIQSESDRL